MSLTESQKAEADDIFVSLIFERGDAYERARVALELWIGNDPERLKYATDYASLASDVDEQAGLLRERYPRQVSAQKAPATVLAMRFKKPFAFAGFGTVALAAALWWINPVLSQQQFSTPIGGRSEITLTDGSHVALNTQTSLRFQERLRSREVTLDSGEALFDVRHEKIRTFHVSAGAADVRDIGTRFTVRVHPNDVDVDVAVLEGQVELTFVPTASRLLMSVNDAARTSGGQIAKLVEQRAFEEMVSWKDGMLQFSATPLRQVVEELQRYRTGRIVMSDRDVAALRISGGFASENPDLLLTTLPKVLPVTVRIANDGTAFIGARQ